MKIFLSYASKYRLIADDLCCRLQAVGHEVFFDREDLRAGVSFDDRIRSAIEDSDLFIFLISPEAVAAGHYTRTEVKIASRKWPTPGWHVLPVQVAETPLADIPAYLRALTIMQAEGNLAAEVVLEVEDRVRANAVEPQHSEPRPPDSDSDSRTSPSEPAGVHYRSMQLRFARDATGGYSIAVPESPSGERGAEFLALDTPALERALWSGAQAIDGSARRSMNDSEIDALLPAATNAREVGQALYTALFASPLRACFEDSLRAIDPQRGEGLRFLINTTDAPDLARLPWEFLYSPIKDDFLFSDRMKPVVRWLDVDEPPPTLAVKPPLRLLIAIAAPADRPGLRIGEEIAHLDHALDELTSSGGIETIRLDHTTLESLDSALLQAQPHILHFIGHGDFIGDEGMLVLESDSVPGTADTIAGRQLAVLLRNHLTSLRLVFLNSCMGATSSSRDPFGGVAQSLIRRGIPAVIAMQFPIPDKAAVALSRHFYRYLAAGQPVDAALTSARAFLYARGYAVEWGAPALHMRTPDGRLFDLAAAPRTPPVAKMAPADEQQSAASPPQLPPTNVTLSQQPVSDKGGKRRTALAAIAGIVLLGAAALWFTSSRESTPDADQLPGPPLVGAPAPMPVPPAHIQARPVYQAVVRLQAGDSAGAAELLLGIIGQDQAALTRERLGATHAPLAQTLGDAAERAFIAGDFDLGRRLVDVLGAMSPFDAALEARLRAQIERWLAEASVEEIVVEASAATTATPGIDIGGYMVYTVRRGDTLWGIARRLTGDGRNWKKLLSDHNRALEVGLAAGSRIAEPARILPGQRIFLALSQAAGFRAIEYRVVRGETLSGIALRIYGDAQMWRAIYRDNERQLPNPDLIRPGQVLVLRPREPQ